MTHSQVKKKKINKYKSKHINAPIMKQNEVWRRSKKERITTGDNNHLLNKNSLPDKGTSNSNNNNANKKCIFIKGKTAQNTANRGEKRTVQGIDRGKRNKRIKMPIYFRL